MSTDVPAEEGCKFAGEEIAKNTRKIISFYLTLLGTKLYKAKKDFANLFCIFSEF